MYIGIFSKNFRKFQILFTKLYKNSCKPSNINIFIFYLNFIILRNVTKICRLEIQKVLYTLYICKTNIREIKKLNHHCFDGLSKYEVTRYGTT